MAGFLDDAEIGIPCPGCDHETPKSIGWIKANDKLVCGGCGETIDLQSTEFRKSLVDVERAIRDITKGLK